MNSDISQRFNDLIQTHRMLKKQFQAEAQSMLKEAASEFFKNNPGIKLICWTQYTPYFNDGDTCTFRVNDVYFSNAEGDDQDDICGWGEYEGENPDVWSDLWNYLPTNNPTFSANDCHAISEMISSSDMEDVLLEMFGDHAAIKLSATGFSINEHEHD